jgi:serine/threonine protein kinase
MCLFAKDAHMTSENVLSRAGVFLHAVSPLAQNPEIVLGSGQDTGHVVGSQVDPLHICTCWQECFDFGDEQLGVGAYAAVTPASLPNLAVKRVIEDLPPHCKARSSETLAKEIALLSAIHHPHIVRSLAVVTQPGQPDGLVLERASRGSLSSWAMCAAPSSGLTTHVLHVVLISPRNKHFFLNMLTIRGVIFLMSLGLLALILA